MVPRLSLAAVVLDCSDAHALATFYRELLGWEDKGVDHDWVTIGPPDSGTRLSFQSESWYEAPAWPERPDAPHKMVHLDIHANDLDAAVELAVELGATVAAHQPQEGVRVLLDPAGHPFCLFTD